MGEGRRFLRLYIRAGGSPTPPLGSFSGAEGHVFSVGDLEKKPDSLSKTGFFLTPLFSGRGVSFSALPSPPETHLPRDWASDVWGRAP